MKLKKSTQQNGNKLTFDEWIKIVIKGKPYKIYRTKRIKSNTLSINNK